LEAYQQFCQQLISKQSSTQSAPSKILSETQWIKIVGLEEWMPITNVAKLSNFEYVRNCISKREKIILNSFQQSTSSSSSNLTNSNEQNQQQTQKQQTQQQQPINKTLQKISSDGPPKLSKETRWYSSLGIEELKTETIKCYSSRDVKWPFSLQIQSLQNLKREIIQNNPDMKMIYCRKY